MPGKIVKAVWRLIQNISDNLMHYFVPAWLIGLYFRFHKRSQTTEVERFFVPAFVALNVLILIAVYCNWGYISRRHSLPLVAVTIFYVPIGVQILADWLRDRFSERWLKSAQNRQSWFFVLLAIGGVICSPQLFSPIRVEKRDYRAAARWLRGNAAQEDLIAVPDTRISFYAERKGLVYGKKVPEQARYVVTMSKNGEDVSIEKEMPGAKKVFPVAGSERKSDATIYDLRNYISERVSFVSYRCTKIADEKYKFSLLYFIINIFYKYFSFN